MLPVAGVRLVFSFAEHKKTWLRKAVMSRVYR
jgi:hypothetical protein